MIARGLIAAGRRILEWNFLFYIMFGFVIAYKRIVFRVFFFVVVVEYPTGESGVPLCIFLDREACTITASISFVPNAFLSFSARWEGFLSQRLT